ncbi:MAG: peptidase S51 [Firmicutes bacterium]|nr:peptidase S51 [Bacillota bacterium]
MNVLLSKYNFHEDWIRDELKEYINDDSKVVILPFAFSEKWIFNAEQWDRAYSRQYGKFNSEIEEPFLSFGVKEENIIWLNYYKDSSKEMIDYINNSDILFFTGGLPEKAVERILEIGLLDTLKKYNKLVIGASAGAMVQLTEYYISPDEDYDFFNYYKGLGLINTDFHIEVHYTETKVQMECISKVLKEKTKKIYAIGEKGGVILKDNLIKVYGEVTLFGDNLSG